MPMRIDLLTIFPEMMTAPLAASICGRAATSGAVQYFVHDIRDWATGAHHKVDDRPFGGGPGMVFMCDPLVDAVEAVEKMDTRAACRVLLTPQGEPLRQTRVEWLAHRTQRGDRLRREAALREVRRALHEQHHRLRGDLALDAIDDVHALPRVGCGSRAADTALNYGGWQSILQTPLTGRSKSKQQLTEPS
ncbi:MAG: hypothetical protein EBU31_19025 [Proteobacteria bacterium]|nr:hypothetical protein [Pseudomonadota bacterium]